MLEILKRILQDECQLDLIQPVVVGVSGGPDSLCMLDVLDLSGFKCIVAHFNHKLRSTSDIEADFVRNIAEQRGLDFVLGEGDVIVRSEQEGESIEEAARKARYQFLFTCAERAGAQGVVVGHNADDQVETVLMHLLRGAGMSGLSGMRFRTLPNPWSEQIPLLRPLLGSWRTEILGYCKGRGLDPISDPSNEDRTFFRNRLRHELIPYLETYNPAVRQLIWRTAEVMRGESELIGQLVDEAWEDCLLTQGEGYLAIDALYLNQQPVSVQRHVLRRAIANLRPGLRDISFDAIQMGLEYIHPIKQFAEVDLISGLKLVSEPERLWIAEWAVEIPSNEWPQVVDEASILEIGGTVNLRAGWQLVAESTSIDTQLRQPPWVEANAHQVWVDRSQIQSPLLVRSRRAGDLLQPIGMNGHSLKLSDFMVNEKLPRRSREKWPLVCSGEHIVWVPGYRLAHPFRITDSTDKVVRLKLIPPEQGPETK